MRNNKKNHHFVSQAELRLNAIDSSVPKKNREIYSFTISDRENYSIKLDSKPRVKINDNLSFSDLFSIEIIDKEYRINLEDAFMAYENKISTLTNDILKKFSDNYNETQKVISELFALKFLNTIRNPFCIVKTLNTIDDLWLCQPTNADLLQIYEKIDSKPQSEIEVFTQKFSITDIQYRRWLKILFLLLEPKKANGINLFDVLIEKFFDSIDQSVNVVIFSYSGIDVDKNVLLSDRSYTLTTNKKSQCVFDFNLNSNSFIRYQFYDIRDAMQGQFDQTEIDRTCDGLSKKIHRIQVSYKDNDLLMLSYFNKAVISTSYANVYCKNRDVYLG